jgi:WD40 repeat protein
LHSYNFEQPKEQTEIEKQREEDPKGDLLATLKGHIKEITHLDLRDNRTLISSSLDGELRQWDTMKE